MEKIINESNQSIYCYKGTSVLINNKNIRDKKKLLELEKMIVTYKLAQIIDGETEFKRNLSLDHYLNIHKYLFEDIYPFAGELRQEFTNKTNAEEIEGETGRRIYCNPDFIYDCLRDTLSTMKKDATKIKNRDDILDFLTKYYMELYYIHPFREGNSRTLREFLREYVSIMNRLLFNFGDFELDYSKLEEEDQIKFTKAVIWNTSSEKEKQENSNIILREAFKKGLVNNDEKIK